MINYGSLGFGVNYSHYSKGQCCLLFTVNHGASVSKRFIWGMWGTLSGWFSVNAQFCPYQCLFIITGPLKVLSHDLYSYFPMRGTVRKLTSVAYGGALHADQHNGHSSNNLNFDHFYHWSSKVQPVKIKIRWCILGVSQEMLNDKISLYNVYTRHLSA